MKILISMLALSLAFFLGSKQSTAQDILLGITAPSPGSPALVSFTSTNSTTFNTIGTVTGLNGGHTIRDMDLRVSNDSVYVLSTNSTKTQAQLYTINRTTAALTPIGSTISITGGTDSNRFGMDFNPVTNQLHVLQSNGSSYRINADTGTLIAQEPNLSYAGGTQVTAAAFSNNVVGATSTTLYAYEFNSEDIVTVNHTTGAMTLVGNISPASAVSGLNEMDISPYTGIAYFAMDNLNNGFNFELYTLNLATGAVTLLGDADMPEDLITITVVPEPSSFLVIGSIASFGIWLRKKKSNGQTQSSNR